MWRTGIFSPLKKLGRLTALLSALSAIAISAPSRAQETSHLEFVTLFIHHLGNVEAIRSIAADELKTDTNNMSACVRNATRFQLELHAHVAMLQGMRLNPPFETLPRDIADFNEEKIKLYRKMSEECEAMLLGPSQSWVKDRSFVSTGPTS